jgi:hypothetical protein
MRRRFRAAIVLTLVPTLVLSAMWNWARDRSRAEPVETLPVAADVVDVDRAVVTPVLSMRRQADAVAAAAARDRRSAGLIEALADLRDDDCLSMTTGGVDVVDHRVDMGVTVPGVTHLLVASAAIAVLGPGYVSTTRVLGAEPDGGRIDGDLYLVGGGDAFLGTEALSGPRTKSLTGHDARLETLVRALTASGITSVDGDIVGVDERYPVITRAPGDAATAAALVVDGGRIITSPVNRGLDPAQTAARTLDELLRRAGISVSGTVRLGAPREGAIEIAAIDGAPLVDVVSSLDPADSAMWGIAPWNWTIEVALTRGQPSSLDDALSVVADVIGSWGVDEPALASPGGPAVARVSCRTLAEAVDRLSASGALGESPPASSAALEAGIDLVGGSTLALVRGQTASGLSVTAIGDRTRIQRAIAGVEMLLADTSEEPPLAVLGPLVTGAS